MKAIVKHEGEIIATVQTNHSMSVEEVLQIAGVDINEMEDENTPKYNYDALRLEMEQEYLRDQTNDWGWDYAPEPDPEETKSM